MTAPLDKAVAEAEQELSLVRDEEWGKAPGWAGNILRALAQAIDSEARRSEREKTLYSVCRRLCLDCYNGSPAEPDKANPTSGRWYHTRDRDGAPLPCGHSCEAQEVQQMRAPEAIRALSAGGKEGGRG